MMFAKIQGQAESSNALAIWTGLGKVAMGMEFWGEKKRSIDLLSKGGG